MQKHSHPAEAHIGYSLNQSRIWAKCLKKMENEIFVVCKFSREHTRHGYNCCTRRTNDQSLLLLPSLSEHYHQNSFLAQSGCQGAFDR
jgi:hypothetical protein